MPKDIQNGKGPLEGSQKLSKATHPLAYAPYWRQSVRSQNVLRGLAVSKEGEREQWDLQNFVAVRQTDLDYKTGGSYNLSKLIPSYSQLYNCPCRHIVVRKRQLVEVCRRAVVCAIVCLH